MRVSANSVRVLFGEEPEEEAGQQRPHDRAGVIHRAVQAEDVAPRRRFGPRREQGIARRGTDSLADPVGQPHGQHVQPGGGQPHQRPGERRDGVAGDDKRLARAPAVGEAPGEDLQHAVQRFGGPLDDADRHGRPAERPRQVERHDRVDRLRRGVGEEAGPRDQPHRPRKARAIAEQSRDSRHVRPSDRCPCDPSATSRRTGRRDWPARRATTR